MAGDMPDDAALSSDPSSRRIEQRKGALTLPMSSAGSDNSRQTAFAALEEIVDCLRRVSMEGGSDSGDAGAVTRAPVARTLSEGDTKPLILDIVKGLVQESSPGKLRAPVAGDL